MKVRLCCLLLIIISPFGTIAQKEISMGGMELKYNVIGSEVEIYLSAPTNGWLGVGFNSKNDIVGSDLLLFHVVNDKVEGLDMYVVGVGNPKEDDVLGGSNHIELLESYESSNSTKVKFKIPLVGDQDYDHTHRLGEPFWLIMAYSTHDDFGHHSRMRRHVPFSLVE